MARLLCQIANITVHYPKLRTSLYTTLYTTSEGETTQRKRQQPLTPGQENGNGGELFRDSETSDAVRDTIGDGDLDFVVVHWRRVRLVQRQRRHGIAPYTAERFSAFLILWLEFIV